RRAQGYRFTGKVEAAEQVGRDCSPADAQARSKDLGEGTHVNDIFGIQAAQGWGGGAFIAQQAVRVSLQNQDPGFAADVHDFLAAFGCQGNARWVVEVRDGVEEFDALAGGAQFGNALAQGAGNQAVVIGAYGAGLDLVGLEGIQRTDIGG